MVKHQNRSHVKVQSDGKGGATAHIGPVSEPLVDEDADIEEAGEHNFDDLDKPVESVVATVATEEPVVKEKPNAPGSASAAIILKPEEGTIKHLIHQELDTPPDEVEPGIQVIPIRGKLRKEIWNGDREVLIIPGELVAEWERSPANFNSLRDAKLREHGFTRCQVIGIEPLQPSPKVPGEFVVVKLR